MKDSSLENKNLKSKLTDASDRWMERNRSLVLRQTPIWAKSLIVMLLSLGSIGILGGIFIRIDEIISVPGQLKSIGGTVEVKTPAGGKIENVYYEDGQFIEKGDLLIQFDITEALEQQKTLTKLIKLEESNLKSSLKTIDSQNNTFLSQRKVVEQRLNTKSKIVADMASLVEVGGFQKIQYLQSLDEKFALESQLNDIDERSSN